MIRVVRWMMMNMYDKGGEMVDNDDNDNDVCTAEGSKQ